MKAPNLMSADSLRNKPEDWPQAGLPDGRWVMARPITPSSRPWWRRFQLAWFVLVGRYDALKWVEQ